MTKKALLVSLFAFAVTAASVCSLLPKASNRLTFAETHAAAHHVIEKNYFAPGQYEKSDDTTVTSLCPDQLDTYSYGEKYHWYCLECKKHYLDKECTEEIDLSDFQISPFTSASASDVAEGDLIALNRTDKQKNTDQANNAVYVKDDDRVASFISRSNVNLEGNSDSTGTELRFVFDTTYTTCVTKVTFDYRMYDVGNETFADGIKNGTGAQHFIIQLHNQSSKYDGYGIDSQITRDDAWHSASITTDSFGIGALTFKIYGLRGHFMVSNVHYETDMDAVGNAAKIEYQDNIWQKVTSTTELNVTYGTVRNLVVSSTTTGNVAIGPGNVTTNKFTVDASKYKNLVCWINIPTGVTSYNVHSISWSTSVTKPDGTIADRETIVSGSSQTGWIKLEVNASNYPSGVKCFQFEVTGGSVAGTWQCTSFYGTKKDNQIVLNAAMYSPYDASSTVSKQFDLTKGSLCVVNPTTTAGLPFNAAISATRLASFTKLFIEVFIPESYNNGGVWYFNVIPSSGAAIIIGDQHRTTNGTMVTGWQLIEINTTNALNAFTNGIARFQINHVDASCSQIKLGSVYGA